MLHMSNKCHKHLLFLEESQYLQKLVATFFGTITGSSQKLPITLILIVPAQQNPIKSDPTVLDRDVTFCNHLW